MKIKDAACVNFKMKKKDSENHLNEALEELSLLKSDILLENKKNLNIIKCPFCDMKCERRVELSHTM